MADTPRGGQTFVFTDIEGSTHFVHDLASSYGLGLRIVRRILQTAFEEQGGRQMGSEGDGLFFVFADPVKGVTGAMAAQQKVEHYDWPDDLRLRVRVGIHHGPARLSGGEYVGLTVHEVSRICAAAHGGQMLCSASVVQALEGADDDIAMRDLGAYLLRGIPEARHLFQICAPGLQDDFPPPREALRDGGVRVTVWRRQAPPKARRRPPPPPPPIVARSVDGQDLDGLTRVEVWPASGGTPGAFRLVVLRDGIVEEEYDGLTRGGVGDAATVVNAHSRLIRLDATAG